MLTAHVVEAVRDQLVASGVDAQSDRSAVRLLVENHLDDVDRSAVSRFNRDVTVEEIVDSICGFGPLQVYFDDPTVEEIWINEPGRVFIARDGNSELTTTVLNARQVQELVERMLSSTGRRLDVSSPFVDALLPDGSRLHVVIPDVTRAHWAVNIRKHVLKCRDIDQIVDRGTITTAAGDFLRAAVVSGLNIVVSGGTQAGKTTMLNALLGCVPGRERIISCEETFELQTSEHPDVVAMQTRQESLEGTGHITLRDLVREALRMRPNRLVVGEVRQQEALDLLIAMNSGMPSMASLHANSAREAVTKLCTLPLLAGSNIAADFVVPTVAGCVDLVVHLRTDAMGRRRVREIAALSGRVEAGVIEMSPVFHTEGSLLVRGDGYPPHADRFAAAGYELSALLSSRQVA